MKKNVFASSGAPPLDVQKAALPTEQKRIAEELDQRVAERTGELAAANQELRNEIAERRRAEEALAASERDLSLIVNTVPGLAWPIRSDGHIEFLNQNFLDYLGLAFEQVQKAGWTFPIHPEDVNGFVRAREATLASETVGEVEARIRRFDGEFRWFLCRAVALRDSAGKVVEWFGINFDIEDRKRAEEELRDTQSKLAHMARLMTIGQLTASIAHEVNQPLAGIITNANTCLRMLAAQPPNIEGARETARRTIRDGNRASEVIKRLRALFSKKDPSLEPVDLNEATREVIALSLSKLQANRVILRTELADGLPNVSGDRVQLQQVILNLIQNGSDAMSSIEDRPRDMLVKTERDGHEAICLTVRDVGVGCSEENGGRLFDAFYTTKGGRHGDRSFGQPFHHRASRGPDVDYGQRGPRRQLFVLCTASPAAKDRRRHDRPRRDARIHGASVEVTEFVLTTKVERPLVSVVDDDESIRESLPDLLREFGFAVRAFASAEEFLTSDCIAKTRCLILDIAMPGMTGPDLQYELKRRRREIPIVFITAHADESARPRLIEEGAVECLLKPFSDTDLRKALDMALAED